MALKKRKANSESTYAPESTKRVTRSCNKPSAQPTQAPTESSSTKLRGSKASTTTGKKSRTVKAEIATPSALTKNVNTEKPSSAPESLSITSLLIKTPIQCSLYSPSHPSTASTLIFTHGAGGTLSAPAVVNFCLGFSVQSPVLAFQGSMNLASRVKGFHACNEHVKAESIGEDKERRLVLGGRSMGARAAVMAAAEVFAGQDLEEVSLVLVGYPLQGPKDVRDQILLDLPAEVRVLFVVGDRDAMCPLDLLDDVRSKMKAKSQLVVVRGADHGMHTKPVALEKEVGEETGRIAAKWVDGEWKENVGYVGEKG